MGAPDLVDPFNPSPEEAARIAHAIAVDEIDCQLNAGRTFFSPEFLDDASHVRVARLSATDRNMRLAWLHPAIVDASKEIGEHSEAFAEAARKDRPNDLPAMRFEAEQLRSLRHASAAAYARSIPDGLERLKAQIRLGQAFWAEIRDRLPWMHRPMPSP